MYTANIYSQITVGFATQPKSVLSTVKLQSLAVQTTVIDFEEYSYSLSDVFGYNMCSKITVGFATQLKAVPSTVKIFAVYWGGASIINSMKCLKNREIIGGAKRYD